MANPDISTTPQNESRSYNDEDCGELPPPYSATIEDDLPTVFDMHCKPPSYSEVEAMHRQNVIREMFNLSDDDLEPVDIRLEHNMEHTEITLGSSTTFWGCFFLSLLINWIGLIVGYCIGNTYSSRYGSLTGFGLSLIKWGLLIKHSNCCTDLILDHPWITWVFFGIGLLLFWKGVLTYLQRRKEAEGRYFSCF